MQKKPLLNVAHMSSLTENISSFIKDVKAYVETRIDLAKLEAAEKFSALISNATAILVIAALALCFVAFAGIGLSLLIGAWTGKLWLGFLVVSLVYMLKAVIVWKLRERLIRIPVMNHLLKTFFNDDTASTK